ncbi:MAG: DUF86 domain-containing protein [Thermomicrobiales bacterium]|nr:DUF86 domain-containing protein [Thermomicrobiales bacterium]MCO5222153.1 DUF86 domain-containing protein [Thermomicrobiales bacterium]
MNQQTAKLLHDANSAGQEVQQYAASTTRERFLEDRSLHLIFERLFEIIGIALTKAIQSAPDLQTQIPEVRKIIDTRNRIAHEYAEVNYPLMWFMATQKVPEMCETIERLLEDVPVEEDPA